MNIKPPLYEVKKKYSPDIILVFCGEETLTVVKNSNSLSRWLSLMGVKVSKSPLLSRAMDPPHLLLVGVLAGTARYSSSHLMAAEPHEPPPPPACWASQPSQVIFQSYRPLSSHGRSQHGARVGPVTWSQEQQTAPVLFNDGWKKQSRICEMIFVRISACLCLATWLADLMRRMMANAVITWK